jgi:hypothetical protein
MRREAAEISRKPGFSPDDPVLKSLLFNTYISKNKRMERKP